MMYMDWPNRIIHIPQSYLNAGANSQTFELDMDVLRLDLRALEADAGVAYPTTHNHTAPLTISGTTLSRVVELINDYTILFEDGEYSVDIVGGNSNIGSHVIFNTVRVNSNNSVGLQQIETRAALTDEQDGILRMLRKFETNRTHVNKAENTLTVYDDDGTSVLLSFDLTDSNGSPSTDDMYQRVPK